MSKPTKPTTTSPSTAALAAGLFAALGSSYLGSRVWPTMETSSELTIGVMASAFALGALPTYWLMKRRAPQP